METINVIDAKLDEITNKIRRENKNIRLTRKQCEQMSKNLGRSCSKKK